MRIEYPGAVYHPPSLWSYGAIGVMGRGDHHEAIYRDDKDRQMFLMCLEDVCGKTGRRVHTFMLMGNHYYLLIEMSLGNLVAAMK